MPSRSPADISPAVAVSPAVPWWRVGVMWLVVGGLGVVVIASFMLLATALRHADTVVPYVAVRTAVPNTPNTQKTPNAPAMQARNHAATPAP